MRPVIGDQSGRLVAAAFAAAVALSSCAGGPASPGATQTTPAADGVAPHRAGATPVGDESAPPADSAGPGLLRTGAPSLWAAWTLAPPASPTPSPTPRPTVSAPPATPSVVTTPGLEGWPVPIHRGYHPPPAVAAEGTAYAFVAGEGDAVGLASFDGSGRLRPGWPVALAPLEYPEGLTLLSDGTVVMEVLDGAEDVDVYVFHRLRPDGRELPGWPVRIESASVYPPVEGPSGSLWLESLPSGALHSVIAAYDVTGRMRRGWPVALADGYTAYGSIRIARDGTVYVRGVPTSADGRARLWAFSSGGRVLPGWPITLRSGAASIDVLPDDRLLVTTSLPPATPPQGLCGDASATVFTVIDHRGKTIAGWPRTAKGPTSTPTIGVDGTIYYAMTDRLVALGPDGTVRPGWPVRIPLVYPQCGGGVPLLGPDGSVHVVTGDRILAFTPGGRRKAGWPFVPSAGFTGYPCVADAPWVPTPAFGPDGTLYVPAWVEPPGANGAGRAGITAVDPRGRVVPGWPYAFATRSGGGTGATGLTVAGGHLFATLFADCGAPSLVALEPDGSVVK